MPRSLLSLPCPRPHPPKTGPGLPQKLRCPNPHALPSPPNFAARLVGTCLHRTFPTYLQAPIPLSHDPVVFCVYALLKGAEPGDKMSVASKVSSVQFSSACLPSASSRLTSLRLVLLCLPASLCVPQRLPGLCASCPLYSCLLRYSVPSQWQAKRPCFAQSMGLLGRCPVRPRPSAAAAAAATFQGGHDDEALLTLSLPGL